MKVRMICLTICLLFTGCSYTMDWFETLMTDRADFSIDVSYKSGKLSISWSEDPSGKDFAGYEVYMIPEPWNEYGVYEVIAAQYKLYSSSHFFYSRIFLGSSSTKKVKIPVSASQLKGPGEYYVRVGIIKMNYDSNTKKPYPVNELNYKNHSDLDRISGYKAVYID